MASFPPSEEPNADELISRDEEQIREDNGDEKAMEEEPRTAERNRFTLGAVEATGKGEEKTALVEEEFSLIRLGIDVPPRGEEERTEKKKKSREQNENQAQEVEPNGEDTRTAEKGADKQDTANKGAENLAEEEKEGDNVDGKTDKLTGEKKEEVVSEEKKEGEENAEGEKTAEDVAGEAQKEPEEGAIPEITITAVEEEEEEEIDPKEKKRLEKEWKEQMNELEKEKKKKIKPFFGPQLPELFWGSYVFPANGDRYDGEFFRVGSVEKGAPIRHGYGVHHCSNGSTYKGTWRCDRMEGYGKAEFANGHVYEGDFKENMFHGKGKYTWPNGAYYKGGWFENAMADKNVHFVDGTGIKWSGDSDNVQDLRLHQLDENAPKRWPFN